VLASGITPNSFICCSFVVVWAARPLINLLVVSNMVVYKPTTKLAFL
jgi:hypothetical protein